MINDSERESEDHNALKLCAIKARIKTSQTVNFNYNLSISFLVVYSAYDVVS